MRLSHYPFQPRRVRSTHQPFHQNQTDFSHLARFHYHRLCGAWNAPYQASFPRRRVRFTHQPFHQNQTDFSHLARFHYHRLCGAWNAPYQATRLYRRLTLSYVVHGMHPTRLRTNHSIKTKPTFSAWRYHHCPLITVHGMHPTRLPTDYGAWNAPYQALTLSIPVKDHTRFLA